MVVESGGGMTVRDGVVVNCSLAVEKRDSVVVVVPTLANEFLPSFVMHTNDKETWPRA